MIVKTISATFELKLNLGDYSSVNIGATMWADVEPTESPADAERILWDAVRRQVNEQAYPFMQGSKSAEVARMFAGREIGNKASR